MTRLWPADEIAWGRECLLAGDSVEEIAEAAACGVAEVVANIGPGRLNATQREVVSLYMAGCTFPEIDAARGMTSGRPGSAAAMITDLRRKGVPLPYREGSATTEKWPDALAARLETLWLQGMEVNEIATQLGGGLTTDAVIGKAARLGLPRRRRQTWSEEHIAALKRWWLEGVTAVVIAGRLGGGRTKSAVLGQARRLGLAGTGRTA